LYLSKIELGKNNTMFSMQIIDQTISEEEAEYIYTPCLAQISLALSNKVDAVFFWFSWIDVIKSWAVKPKREKESLTKKLLIWSIS
jgi:hypothetical protein